MYDECQLTCKQPNMHRNQAAPSVVYENGRFEGAVDCPNDVRGRKKKEKRLSIIERMGKKKAKKRKLYTAMPVGVWRLPIMGYRWVF